MNARELKHPLFTVPGAFALILWSAYLLLAIKNLPDLPHRVLISGSVGLIACLAVIANLRYWRGAVLLASSVYLVTYVVLVTRMALIVTGAETSFPSALSLYYGNGWMFTAGTFQEKGLLGGLAYGFLEYAMPVLTVALIIVTLTNRRNASSAFAR
jgi:hypothetical protein